jgi:hypothetical protein
MLDTTKYRVEKTDESGTLGCAYRVYGPRNTEYGLIRNHVRPHMMFVLNMRTMNPNAKIQGHSWFSDKTGELKPST